MDYEKPFRSPARGYAVAVFFAWLDFNNFSFNNNNGEAKCPK